MHQRSCKVIHGQNDELYNDIEEQINIDSENVPEMNQSTSHEESPVNDNDVPNLKKVLRFLKVIPSGQRLTNISNSLFSPITNEITRFGF